MVIGEGIESYLPVTILDGGVECDHQESDPGERQSKWVIGAQVFFILREHFETQAVVQIRWRAAERSRPPGPGVPLHGKRPRVGQSGPERGRTWADLGVSGTVVSMTPATGAVVGAGFQGASSGRKPEILET